MKMPGGVANADARAPFHRGGAWSFSRADGLRIGRARFANQYSVSLVLMVVPSLASAGRIASSFRQSVPQADREIHEASMPSERPILAASSELEESAIAQIAVLEGSRESHARTSANEELSTSEEFSEPMLLWLRRQCPDLRNVGSDDLKMLKMFLIRLAAGLVNMDESGTAARDGLTSLLNRAEAVEALMASKKSWLRSAARRAGDNAHKVASRIASVGMASRNALVRAVANRVQGTSPRAKPRLDSYYEEMIVLMLPLRHGVLQGMTPEEGLGDLLLATVGRLAERLDASEAEGALPFLSDAFNAAYHHALQHCLQKYEHHEDLGQEACRTEVGDLTLPGSPLHTAHMAASAAQVLAEHLPALGVGEHCAVQGPKPS